MEDVMEKEFQEEFTLAKEMKKNHCNKLGKETDIAATGKIIHQIGKLYRKQSPDKLSLIKSAGLYNAAIVRKPTNVSQIRSDLFELCQHILQQAKAENHMADLIKKAEQVKSAITNMRNEVENRLIKTVPEIPCSISEIKANKLKSNKIVAIKEINKYIADEYKSIMKDLSQFGQDVMGKPPCDYAVVGMGSLARKEITHYSDFEHIILLIDDANYNSYLEYFRWYSVIFHIVILNLQETIIPSLNICSLNDKHSRLNDWFYDAITPRGISFDGMMPHACKFPLGRQNHTKNKQFTTELIKPVSKMLEYLSSEADLKNGYHLADILTKTCYVFGNEDIFNQFVKGAQNYRDHVSETVIIHNIEQQVKEDLNNFSTRFRLTNLTSQTSINIKQLVYRSTTIFISALAKKHNISGNSCFEIVDEMFQKNKITLTTANKLHYAVAIACEMRLRVYAANKSQCDNPNVSMQTEKNLQTFLDIVGTASTVNYFQIAYCLQCEIAKQLHLTKLHFYSNPQLINIAICLTFEMPELPSFSEHLYKQESDLKRFNFDKCIEKLEKHINSSLSIAHDSKQKVSKKFALTSHTTSIHSSQIQILAEKLQEKDKYNEALDFYQQLQKYYSTQQTNPDTANIYQQIGICLLCSNRYKDALNYFSKALQNKQNITLNADIDTNLAITLHSIGHCHVRMQQYDDALKHLNRALKIEQNTTLNAGKDRNLAITLNSIGDCYNSMQQYDDALKYLTQALEIKLNTTLNISEDRNLAITLNSIGHCHVTMQRYDEALKYLTRAVQIKLNTTLNAGTDRNLAITLHSIGHCHVNMQQYDDALKYLNRALQVIQNTTLNADTDEFIAATQHSIGDCLNSMHQYDDALKYLNRALKIKLKITLNADKDRNLAITLHCIGDCHINIQQYDDALKYLNRALEIKQNTTWNADKDRSLAITLHSIGDCHDSIQQYDDALKYFKRALDIKLNTTLNANSDTYLARTLYSIGDCHISMQQYNDALKYLNRALKIEQNITLNACEDKNLAKTLNSIGNCHVCMQQYDDALKHLNRALEIKLNTALNPDEHRDLAITLHSIGQCHVNMQQYDDALKYLNRALEIIRNTELNADTDEYIAATLHSIGNCHDCMQQYDDALKYLNRALKIKQNTTLNADNDRSLAITLHCIGDCHKSMQHYDDALTYLNRALVIKQNTTLNANEDRSLAITLRCIGDCHDSMQQYDDASYYLNRELEIK